MAKGKKNKKDLDDEGSIPSDEEVETEEKNTGGKKGKKDKQKKKDEDNLNKAMDKMALSDSDSEPEDKPLPKEKKKDKKKVKKAAASDSDEEVTVQKSGFALLMDDGGDSLPSDVSDNEEDTPVPVKETKPDKKSKGKDKKKTKKQDEDVLDEEVKEEKGGKKKKKKKGKKDDDDDDDLDAMLAALKAEYDGEEPPPEAADAFDKDEGKKGKKKKKGKQDNEDLEDAGQMGFEVIDGMEVGGTVKTAAQKKKEKKERQKQKEFEDKQKLAQKGSKEPSEEKGVSKEPSVEKEPSKEVTPEQEDKEDKEEPGDEGGEGKKKKKKKKKEEEEKKTKKPGNKMLAAMKEALIKTQEEEERLKKEFEDKEREAEERERLRAEQKQKDEEKKALKKQREKERLAKLKAEGKLLTAKQKQEKARAEAMLAAMRAQGVDVPQIGEKVEGQKRPPRAGTRIRPNKKKHGEVKEVTPEVEEPSSKEESPVTVEEEPKVVKEEVKDDWDAESGDDVKDAWDAESDDEKSKKAEVEVKTEEKPTETEKVEEEPVAEESSDDESDESEDESEEESDEESEDESDEDATEAEKKRDAALARIQKRRAANEKNRTTDKLRSPVVCVLGHVDTGKTKILDKLRRTNVQDGEAGGITQQIGATNVPIDIINEQCKMVKGFGKDYGLKLPGLLIIDTPGHESFSNLRDRGSSLCDIAILVIDIMHGLEPQTIESINLLKKKKTPFVVALNKIDRLYEWKANRHMDVRDVLSNQQHNTMMEFEKRKNEAIVQLNEQGLNAALFYENPDPSEYISLVPTSAHSGDGMGNLMGLLVEMSESFLAKRLSFSEELQATVLEVKDVGGFGTTIDIVLVNGSLKFGQTMIIAGTDGPIVTTIKALLTPKKLQDLRVKTAYVDHKNLEAAQGVKIAAKELGKAIAGLNMRVAYHPDEVDILREECERDLSTALNAIKVKTLGVFVQASTLGSLEALLEFLKTSEIPYAGVRIGPVVRRDVMRACAMLDHEPKYAVILAFDVKVERDAQEFADKEGVKIFQADIIYHLFDRFTEYQAELVRKKKDEFRNIAVFPCKLKIMPENVFMSRDPIVCGVTVVAGIVKPGTPICVPSKEFVNVGICTSLQHNNKEVQEARKGSEVCIKIEPLPGEAPKMFGRHFDENDLLISKISRESIDACKDYFRDDLVKTDWILMKELKKLFEIL